MDRNHTDNFEDKDFKQEFYRWFESRGLLFELKSFMRLQMVRSLQESNINGTNVTNFRKKCSSSPKFQAMNLLIADFLLQQTCLYTVSVFASEVPTLNNFPDFSSYVSKVLHNAKDTTVTNLSSIPRFSYADVQDILETLGLPTNSRVGRLAAEQYMEQGEALLTCIVRALTAQNIGTTREQVRADNSIYSLAVNDVEDDIYFDAERDRNHRGYDSVGHWTDGFRDILLDADFKISHINRIQKEVKRIHEEEIKRVHEEEAMKYENMTKQWEERLKEQAKEEAERKLLSRLSKVETREENVKSLAAKLRAEHKEITKRLVEFQDQMEKVQEKEKQQELDNIVFEKEKSDLIIHKKQLEEVYNRLAAEQETVANTKDELQKKSSELIKQTESNKILKEQYSALWTELSEARLKVVNLESAAAVSESSAIKMTTSGTQTVNVVHREQSSTQTVVDNTDKEQQTSEKSYSSTIDELKKEIEVNGQLEQENIELRAHILRLHGRISELNSRAANVSSQLQEAQTTIENLRNRNHLAITTPPLAAPQQPIIEPFRPHMNWNQRRLGAGEELFFTPLTSAINQSSPATVPLPPQRQDTRKTPRKFTLSHNQLSSSDESSPTDEALQETRRRLRTLEEESEAVNRRYREFQERQLQATNSIIINPGIHARIFGSSVRERNIFLPISLQSHDLNTHIQISQPSQQNSRIPTFTTGVHIRSQMNQSDVTEDSSSGSSQNFLFSSRHANVPGANSVDNRHVLSSLRKIPPPHNLYKKFFKYKFKNMSKTVYPKSQKINAKARETPLGSSVNQEQALVIPNPNNNSVEFQQDSNATNQDIHSFVENEKIFNERSSSLPEEHKLSSASSVHERSEFFQNSEDEKLVTVKQPYRTPSSAKEEKSLQGNSAIKNIHTNTKHATDQPNCVEKFQNPNFMSSSAKSSESLAVESLPLDSDSKLTLNTESGLPVEHNREIKENKTRVIHNLDLPLAVSTFTENVNTGDELTVKPGQINISESVCCDKKREPEFEPLSVPDDIIIHHAPVISDTNKDIQERFSGAASLQVLNEDIVPLTRPNISLMSSSVSLLKKSEDNFDDKNMLSTDTREEIQGAAAVSSQEMQPAYASSVTSGSDIIRELNTSGNSSSESESSISAGIHIDSHHSSDFWD